ncbi:hypothetical protein FVE85_1646 [Porphyridium purpureum]|uniref:Uncharacterized protein n=1 Tax=Porphyridium purpureum TaxID=35688 RepID=A0A5J4YVG1_PORPP|nr:hypothetical protein FVE85_1646 [Porphyridium purpureum]|eukprot:POR3479..scf209_3
MVGKAGRDRDDGLDLLVRHVVSWSASSAALDVALGIALGAGLIGILWYNYTLFEPYMLPLLVAAVVSTSMRRIRDGFLMVIAPAVAKSQRDRQTAKTRSASCAAEELREKQDDDREKDDGTAATKRISALEDGDEYARWTKSGWVSRKNHLMLLAVIILLAVRQPKLFAFFVSVLVIYGTMLAAGVIVTRILVMLHMVDPNSAASGLTMLSFVGFAVIFLGLFLTGSAIDVVSGARDGTQYLIRIVQDDPSKVEWIQAKMGEVQDKAQTYVVDNVHNIERIASQVGNVTGVDVMPYVQAGLQSALGRDPSSPLALQSGNASGSELGGMQTNATELLALMDAELLKDKARELYENLQPYVPRSVGEVQELIGSAKERLGNVEQYLDMAREYTGKGLTLLAKGFSKLVEVISSLSWIGSFLAFLFLFLRSEDSAISYLTNMLPLPTKSLNNMIERDLRSAISAIFWVSMRFFMLHVAFVWISFSALGLNFEFIAALLAGLSQVLPFMPPAWVFSLCFSAPQLIAQRRWVEFAALPLVHMFYASDQEDYLETVQERMVVGKSILNYELLTVASVLGLSVFGQQGLLIAPLLITFSLVIYEVFRFIILKEQDRRQHLLD